MAKVFIKQRPGETLEAFLKREIQPSKDEIKGFKESVNAFAEFLREDFSYGKHTVAEVLKSGSLGKGTAVKGTADIDLVVFMNGLSSIRNLEKKRADLLEALKEEIDDYEWDDDIECIKTSKFSVSYRLGDHEVDILPAFDVLEEYDGADGVYSKMAPCFGLQATTRNRKQKRNRIGQQYSASLAPLQVDFVKPQPSEVKDAIRLLKYWKRENDLDIRSYCLELLAIHANETKKNSPTVSLFRGVLSMLTDCHSLHVAFDTNYTSSDYTQFRGTPYILDPANPFMNTFGAPHVKDIQRSAKGTLQLLTKAGY